MNEQQGVVLSGAGIAGCRRVAGSLLMAWALTAGSVAPAMAVTGHDASVAASTTAVASTAAVALEAPQAALDVMDAFMATFNARDVPAWADTLVYPHVRIASGEVMVYPDRENYIATHDLDAFARSTGWVRSAWDDMRVIQSGPGKVHIAVRFTRYDADDNVISSFDSLYIVEQVGDRWGIRARSSFAP